MITKKLQIKVVSPNGLIFDGEGKSVNLKTSMGEITILPNHTEIIANLFSGNIKIETDKGKEIIFNYGDGVIEVKKNSQVIILADNIKQND
jgi:F-type H+-transporting ATPase subunit epsilon